MKRRTVTMEKKKFIIHPERKKEFSEIYKLIQIAFETAKVKDGDEQDFANRLRSNGSYVPELALVAECNGQLIGHIMLTHTLITSPDGHTSETLMIAPLSVKLEFRNQGVGAALINEGLRLATQMGYKAAFLCGDPAYYQRFGFKAIQQYGIRQIDLAEELQPYFMGFELIPDSLKNMNGTINLHA